MSRIAKAFVVGRAQKLARTPHLPGLDYRLFSESQFSEHFRFSSVEHVDELAAALGLPLRLTTPTGLVSTGRDALLLVLRRLCYSTRMITLAEEFGRSKGAVSALFNFTIELLAERWADVLLGDNCCMSHQRLQLYANAVQQQLGLASSCVVGYIDGTLFPVHRPSYGQEAIYNGKDRQHACVTARAFRHALMLRETKQSLLDSHGACLCGRRVRVHMQLEDAARGHG